MVNNVTLYPLKYEDRVPSKKYQHVSNMAWDPMELEYLVHIQKINLSQTTQTL